MSEPTSASGEPVLQFKGLTPEEVEASRNQHGDNAITPPPETPWWQLYKQQFDDPVIRILVIAALAALVVGAFEGKYVEALGIIIAIFLATFMAFYNEYKAQKQFELLERASDDDLIKVIRSGNPTQVRKRHLVVGDIVPIEKGEEPPADGRILQAVSLEVNEASLTGESEPIHKATAEHVDPQAAADATYPLDRVYRGAEVTDGHATIELTAVGDRTEIGKIAGAIGEGDEVQTPLSIQLERLSKLIGVLAFLVAALLFSALVGRGVLTGELDLTSQQWGFVAILFLSVMVALVRVWLPILCDGLELLGRRVDPPMWLGLGNGADDQPDEEQEGRGELVHWLATMGLAVTVFGIGCGIGHFVGFIPGSPSEWLPKAVGEEFLTYFMIAVTIIVLAVPEGLAMSVTLSLAYSVSKLMADNNLVRRMHAAETIGATTVICTDKTGTLTRNEMRVREAQFPCLRGQSPLSSADGLTDCENLIVEGITCNTTGDLDRSGGEVRPLGNPTESALLLWLEDHGIDYVPHRLSFEIIYQLPFDNRRKYMGTLGVSPSERATILHVKGAPEVVLDHCTEVLTPEGVAPLDRHKGDIEAALEDYEARGMRCLAFAYYDAPEEGHLTPEQLTAEMTWLGFVAIEDPVREEVPDAIRACHEAGIEVKIITGDNQRTAKEVARQIGLGVAEEGDGDCRLHDEFQALSEEEAREAARELKILARAHPTDKERLVQLLQEQGEVVAVTGDGVNDVPALDQAQVGLSMGITGTDAARKASDIVILDDAFSSIVTGVMWGRSLYQNIQRFILFQLTINVVACGVALLGPFIGVKLPLTVTQMLWVNLIMDTFAALALATEQPHEKVMQQPPRDPQQFIITAPMARNILSVGFTFLVFLVGLLLYIQTNSHVLPDGSPVTPYELSVFFTVFVMLQFWNLFNARCLGLTQSAFRGLRSNPWFVIIAGSIFVGQVLFVQFGGEVFRTVPLSAQHWIIIVGGTSVVVWAGELWRLVARVRDRRQGAVA